MTFQILLTDSVYTHLRRSSVINCYGWEGVRTFCHTVMIIQGVPAPGLVLLTVHIVNIKNRTSLTPGSHETVASRQFKKS